jgi:hypothetical protein
VIGAHPNRSDLVAVVAQLGWVPLGRSEKRVKQLLIQRLEEMKDQLLPLLDSPQGRRALENAYLSVLNRRSVSVEKEQSSEPVTPFHLPPEATVEFYLNRHDWMASRRLS